MKKTPHIKIVFKWVVALTLISGFAACSSDDDGGNKKKPASGDSIRNTAIVYMAADNNLGYEEFSVSDSSEISNGTVYLNARDQVILYYDNANDTRIYRFYKGSTQPQLVRSFNKNMCSSDPAVLKDVLTWIKEKYPSESYGLTCWSHGDGWIPSHSHNYAQKGISQRSFGIDCGPGGVTKYNLDRTGFYGAAMDMDSLAWAIEQSGIHMKYIFFDACLMQCLESDYELRNVTDYIVASPISIAAIGTNYTTLIRSGFFTDNPDNIAKNIYEYMTHLPSIYSVYYNYGVVFSTVKTSELEALASLTAELLPSSKLGGTGAKKEIDMSNVQHYSVYSSDYFYRPEYYDAACTMKQILSSTDYERWKAQLDKCVIGKYSTSQFYYDTTAYGQELFLPVDLDNYSGISMFMPQNRYTNNAKRSIYGNLNSAFQKTAWYKAAGWNVTGW